VAGKKKQKKTEEGMVTVSKTDPRGKNKLKEIMAKLKSGMNRAKQVKDSVGKRRHPFSLNQLGQKLKIWGGGN